MRVTRDHIPGTQGGQIASGADSQGSLYSRGQTAARDRHGPCIQTGWGKVRGRTLSPVWGGPRQAPRRRQNLICSGERDRDKEEDVPGLERHSGECGLGRMGCGWFAGHGASPGPGKLDRISLGGDTTAPEEGRPRTKFLAGEPSQGPRACGRTEAGPPAYPAPASTGQKGH